MISTYDLVIDVVRLMFDIHFYLSKLDWMSDGSSSRWTMRSPSRLGPSSRPKTAFQTLNRKFEKVLSELRGVHLRTMKPASLPPISSVSTR